MLRNAYIKNYDLPDHFIGSIETIPIDVFKSKIHSSNGNMIHASKINTAIALFAEGTSSAGPGIGTPVAVDGFHGRGVIVRINKDKITIRFPNGMYVTRSSNFVHPLSDNYYKSQYSSVR